MKIENFISLRYIRESRLNRNISESAAIVISVIASGIIFFICALSIMNGYIEGLLKIYFEVKSFHVDYSGYYDRKDTENVLADVLKDSRVQRAGLYRESKVLLSAKGKNTGLVYFRSIEENLFNTDPGFDQCLSLVEGKKSLGKNEIFLSEKTASKLRVKPGDSVFIVGIGNEENAKIRLYKLTVSGLFTTGFADLDEQIGYVGHETGGKIMENLATWNIWIKLKDYKDSREFVRNFYFKGILSFTPWEDLNYNELTALNFEKNIIAFIIILVIFVAVLNILTTIYITILEKSTDIGILKACGYSPSHITGIFLFYGIYLGLIGIIIGTVAGLVLMTQLNNLIEFISWIINQLFRLQFRIESLFGTPEPPEMLELFSKDFYLDRIYTRISFAEIITISVITLIFSILSSILPAKKAGKIKPNEVIRNG